MNQSFELSRWLMLVSKHWSENRKKYTLSLIAMAGLLLVWFVFALVMERARPIDDNIQFVTYYFGLFLVGCLYASMLFADLSSKSKGMNYLAIPASHFEKLLCTLFYGVIAFFICYTLLFYLIDAPMVKLSNAIAYSHWQKTHLAGSTFEAGRVLNVFTAIGDSDNHGDEFYHFLLAYFALQSAFIFGSVYFPKFSFIKTVISLLLISLFFVFFVGKVLNEMMPYGSFYKGITSYRVFHVEAAASGSTIVTSNDITDKLVSLPSWIEDVLIFIAKYAFAPIFWTLAYYRLKEKEI